MTNEAMEKRGLRAPHGVTTHTSADRSSFWAQRQTVSGWWLARGLTLNELGLSTTLEYEADPTLENEATGSSSPSLPRLGF